MITWHESLILLLLLGGYVLTTYDRSFFVRRRYGSITELVVIIAPLICSSNIALLSCQIVFRLPFQNLFAPDRESGPSVDRRRTICLSLGVAFIGMIVRKCRRSTLRKCH